MKNKFLKIFIILSLFLNILHAQDIQEKDDEYDTSKYTKVKLIDAVLETIAQSEILKSSRENVVRYEIKLKNAMADYYPTVDFEYVNGRTRSNPSGDDEKKFKFFNDEHYKLTLKQNVYSGGATNNMVKSVRKKLEVAKNQYKIKLDQEIKKAIKAYFDVVFTNRSVMVNERNMKKLNKILEIVTIKYDNGAASIGDLTSIKANVANAVTKLVRVKSSFIEALRYYEYIVGTRFEKTLPYEKNFDIKIDEFDKLFERALENNRNLINYYKSITAEKFKHKSVRGRFEPKVDFELSYKETMQGEDSLEHERDLQGKFRVSYNLFNAGRDKNSVLQLNSDIRDLNYKLEEEKKKLKWNLSKLHTSISSVSKALKSTVEEVVSSRKMVSSYWEAFKTGEQDLQALLQGQKQLNAAETELVNFEKNQINDFFAILELTGDLSAFFDVNPENVKYIDFSKSDYKKTVLAKDGKEISLEVEEKEVEEKEEPKENIQLEEPKQIEIPKKPLEEKIDNFIKEFTNFDDESYMIKISDFSNIYEAFVFIKNKNIDNNSFAFDILDDLSIKNIVVHNNFENEQLAKEYISTFKNESSIEKNLSIIKVKDAKKLYKNYLEGLRIIKPKPKIKIVEKIRQEKTKKEFTTNQKFKKEFFSADEEFYTINISSFTSKKELEDFIVKNDIYENSFFFRYSSSMELYKLVMGIYKNYQNIETDINMIALNNEQIFPVVEKIKTIKQQYDENIELNTKIDKPKEYEIVSLKNSRKEKARIEAEAKRQKAAEEEEEEAKRQKAEEEKARIEAEAKAEEEAKRQKAQALEKARIEAEAKAEKIRLEAKRQKAAEEEEEEEEEEAKKQKAEEEKARIEAEAKAEKIRLEAKRQKAEEEAKRQKAEEEKLRIEAEIKAEEEAKRQKAQALEKARLEAEVKAEKIRLETEKKEQISIENNKEIEHIDLSKDKQEIKEFIPYKKRVEIFKEEFKKADENKYTLHLATIKPNELSWYRNRFALEPNHIIKTANNKIKIYFGIFNTKEEALQKVNYLYPLIYESNPSAKTIGSVR